MKTAVKKMLALFMAVVLCVGLLPTTAHAATTTYVYHYITGASVANPPRVVTYSYAETRTTDSTAITPSTTQFAISDIVDQYDERAIFVGWRRSSSCYVQDLGNVEIDPGSIIRPGASVSGGYTNEIHLYGVYLTSLDKDWIPDAFQLGVSIYLLSEDGSRVESNWGWRASILDAAGNPWFSGALAFNITQTEREGITFYYRMSELINCPWTVGRYAQDGIRAGMTASSGWQTSGMLSKNISARLGNGGIDELSSREYGYVTDIGEVDYTYLDARNGFTGHGTGWIPGDALDYGFVPVYIRPCREGVTPYPPNPKITYIDGLTEETIRVKEGAPDINDWWGYDLIEDDPIGWMEYDDGGFSLIDDRHEGYTVRGWTERLSTGEVPVVWDRTGAQAYYKGSFLRDGTELQYDYTSRTFVVYYDPLSYHVFYDGNGNTGGTAPVDGMDYHKDDSATVKDEGDLVKEEYAFYGWNTKADGSGSYYAPTSTFLMPAADVTLYAQWEPYIYVIYQDYETGDERLGNIFGAEYYRAPGRLLLPTNEDGTKILPALEELTGDLGFDTRGEGLDLRFLGDSVTVRYILESDEEPFAEQHIPLGQLAVAPTSVPDKAGYRFTGWFEEGAEQPFNFRGAPLIADVTLYAGWEEMDDVTITYAVGGDTTATWTESVTYNTAPSAPNTSGHVPANGILDAWYSDEACTQKYEFGSAVTEDFTLYGSFEEKATVTVTYSFPSHEQAVWTQQVVYGSTIAPPEWADFSQKIGWPEEENDGFQRIKGTWYTDERLSNRFDFNTPVTADLNLYNSFVIYLYHAVFVDGTEVFPDAVINYGSSINWTLRTFGSSITFDAYMRELLTIDAYPSLTDEEVDRLDAWYLDADGAVPLDLDQKFTEPFAIYGFLNTTPPADAGKSDVTVTYVVSGDASATWSETVAYKGTLSAPDTSGHVPTNGDLDGWYTDEDRTQAYSFGGRLTGDLTLYAGFSERNEAVTVTFAVTGDREASWTAEVLYGSTATAPDVGAVSAARSWPAGGIVRWFSDEGHQNTYAFTERITQPRTIYGQYSLPEYSWIAYLDSVRYDTGLRLKYGTIPAQISETVSWEIELEMCLCADLGVDYEIVHQATGNWYADADGAVPFDPNTPATGEVVTYAWVQTTSPADVGKPDVTVTYVVSGDASATWSETVAYKSRLSAPDTSGHVPTNGDLDGWYTDEACTLAYSFGSAVTGDFTLYAKFKTSMVTVNFTFPKMNGEVLPVTIEKWTRVSEPTWADLSSEFGWTRESWNAQNYESVYGGKWYTQAEYSKPERNRKAFDFRLTSVSEDLTLYSPFYIELWIQPIPYLDGVQFKNVPDEVSITYGHTMRQDLGTLYDRMAWWFNDDGDSYTIDHWDGWYLDRDRTEPFDLDAPLTENKTIYGFFYTQPEPTGLTFRFPKMNNAGWTKTVNAYQTTSAPTWEEISAQLHYPNIKSGYYSADAWYTDTAHTKRELSHAYAAVPLTAESTARSSSVVLLSAIEPSAPSTFVKDTLEVGDVLLSDDGNAYVFQGWRAPYLDQTDGNIHVVATWTLLSASAPPLYTVTWLDEDLTLLERDTDVPYGTMPSYDSAEPTKAPDETYTWAFTGWTPTPVQVTQDATYIATYTPTPKPSEPATPSPSPSAPVSSPEIPIPTVNGGGSMPTESSNPLASPKTADDQDSVRISVLLFLALMGGGMTLLLPRRKDKNHR